METRLEWVQFATLIAPYDVANGLPAAVIAISL